jgi:hypothetical protein
METLENIHYFNKIFPIHDQFHVTEQQIDLFDHLGYFCVFLSTRIHLDNVNFSRTVIYIWIKSMTLYTSTAF